MKMKIPIVIALSLFASSALAQGQTGQDKNRSSAQNQPGTTSTASQQTTQGENKFRAPGQADNQTSSGQSSSQSSQSSQPGAGSSSSSSSLGGQSSQTGQSSSLGSTGQSRYGTQPGAPSSGPATTGTQPGQSRVGAPASGTQTSPGTQPGSLDSSRFDPSAQGRPGAQETGQQTTTANVQLNQQHVTQLQTAFSQLKAGGTAQNQQLTQTIMSMAQSGKVSQEYVTRFVTDLGTVLPRVTLAAPAQQRLATTIAYVLSPNIQATQLEPMLTQVRQTLVQSGVPAVAAQTIACDLHLLAAEAHPELLEVRVSP